jgi:hypothetical protein
MSKLKKNIKLVLKEEEKRYLHDRGAYAIVKIRHQNVYNYMKESRGEEVANEWPGSFDEYINGIKSDITSIGSTTELSRICGDSNNPLVQSIEEEYCLRIVSNYFVNYGEDNKVHYDVINVDSFGQFLEDNFFICNEQFFEYVWDNVLSERNRWGSVLKEKMWEEILPEVEEKMEDEEFIEDNMVEFETLEREESYFLSYWHYPLQSLGWTKENLCDWYVDTIGRTKLYEVLIEEKLTDFAKIVGRDNYYYIFKKELFY